VFGMHWTGLETMSMTQN